MLAALAIAQRYWKYAVMAVLVAIVGFQHATISRKSAALQHANDVMALTTARIEQATLTFKANAITNARRIEQAQFHASAETASEYASNLARAQALAADYARRLRNGTQAASGASRGADQSGTPDAAGTASGAGSVPIMDDDDFRVCTENTVKSLSWRAWWSKVSAIPR